MRKLLRKKPSFSFCRLLKACENIVPENYTVKNIHILLAMYDFFILGLYMTFFKVCPNYIFFKVYYFKENSFFLTCGNFCVPFNIISFLLNKIQWFLRILRPKKSVGAKKSLIKVDFSTIRLKICHRE